jgi:hypothetical protein
MAFLCRQTQSCTGVCRSEDNPLTMISPSTLVFLSLPGGSCRSLCSGFVAGQLVFVYLLRAVRLSENEMLNIKKVVCNRYVRIK